ncbi:mucin-2-like isoform X1 [Portunus trituberculatus]|uniref:mucin-2-like isoform X1 n=1 Tax=Portunus trituberculatus TaxID=210409 RepID=UPI001E1CEC05|nr:mucin-2-like isoform X1 [Portunus trituberculatus]XP_045135460.1 mucin-2-like isoform X1 [Portunus trituberculatus]XP_045135461.1 mucin-2-like isoform X1 [Portunus trituberculatus]XP_045135462.1 mucin-2-like isoform X1 [Portunus trituberculatus]
MAAPSTRWLCLLRPLFFLLLLQGSRVAAQLTIGSADSFLPEHLDANAVSTTGKTIEVTPLSDASVTNAAADAVADAAAAETASDANSPGASEADDYLFTATDSPSEDTTLPDFDDYTVDGTETTTKFSTPENDVTEPGKIADLPDYLVDGEQGDSVTTASSDLTRRIVFTGPDATATTPSVPLQSTRPSSVLRELNDPTTASWLPNWPSHLLEATKEFRRPSVRFPTGPPPTATQDTTLASSATISPSYTVTKVPVTQYYFDLASVNPTPIPGPLFDRETVTTSSSVVSSVLPDVTQPLESEDLPSSISELQSSVLVDAAEPPVTSTPALPPSTTSIVVTTDAFQSITPSATTETVPPTSTVLNEVVEGHLDNTLTEESQTSGTAVKETPETSEVMPSGSGSTQSGFHSEHSENTTTEDPDSLFSLAATSEAPQPTNISQPVTQPSTLPAPSTNSEPLTTTSSTTPGSVKPSSARTSPAAKTSRIPLWQRLSQSSPSRPNTQPSSTPLTPSNAATLAADAVMPLSSALPPLQSTSVEPPLALDESSPVLAPSPPRNESIQEPVIPDEQDPPTPLDIDDPDEVLTRAMKSETGSVVHNSTEPPSSALEPTEYPLADTPELNTNTEAPQNTTTQDSNVDTLSPASIDQHSSVDNTSNVEVVDNALDGTHPNTLPSSNTSENKTQHGNGIFDDPKVSDDEPLPIPVQGEKDPVVDPSEIPVTLAPTVSVTWTPIIEETESVPLPTSTASVPIATTVVTQTPPEILTGFTPIISATHTIPTSQSELVPDGSATSASSASTVEFVDSSTTTSAPAQDLSTPSAPSSTLTASLAPTTVHKTDSESLYDSSITESVYQSVKKIDKILPSSDLLPSTLYISEMEDTLAVSQTPTFTGPLKTSSSPEFLVPEVESTVVESLLESTVLATEDYHSSPTLPVPDILPSPSETIVPVHTSHITHTNLSSVPPVSFSVPQSTVSPTFPEISVTSSPSRPHEVSKSLPFVFYQSLPESTVSPVSPDMPLSSPVPVLLDAPVSSNVLDVPLSSGTPIPPEVLVSSPVPVPLDVPVSSAVPAPPDVPVSSAVPVLPDVPVSSAVPDPDPSVTSTVPVLPDVLVSSSVPASSDVPVSSAAPVLPDVTESSALPVPPDTYESSVTPDVVVSSAVPVLTEVPVSSATPMSTAVPMLPDAPISSASIAILPTPSLRPTSDSPTLVVPTATDDPIPTLLPQPLHPEEGGEEETHEEMPVKEEASESEMEPPPLPATTLSSPSPPDTTTSTTTTTTSSTTSSTTTTMTTTAPEKVPETEAPAVKPTTAPAPDTTTAFILPEPEMNNTTAAPGEIPMLTTTTVLDNGTEVVVALPYIRALVDYNAREFCQHQDEFRSLFGEWITQDLNGSVKVMPKDIRYFAMADCPSFPSSQDGQTRHEDAGTMQEKNHTHVYFYITSSSGEVDRELTEKFPLFPTDLVISEDLKYLVPRVMQLEVVRPDESSSQDQVQEAAVGTSVIVIIVICSIVGVTIIVALFFFMVVKRRGATNNYYGRRCTPVSMDAYSMDSVSVYHSFRRKSKRRASGRSMKSYLNQAFDDPNGPSRPLNFAKLTHFISDIDGVYEEFATIPVNMPKYDELPPGVEDKNRYANVIPVPETRVLLKVTKDGRNCEYINANFVRGARNESKYYIATQAPLDDTVADFWRMVWEQESRVVVMLTDFVEKGIDKCADYLPPSETLDCHRLYGDFQVTLKSRDMREKFVVSNVQLKNLENNLMREVAHMWFTGWPASGVPNEEGAFISFILEVRRTRKKLRAKGPIVVHCSPGTGRTGTLLASDIVMKQFEEHRTIDVPRTVYAIRRDRAGAVQTKEQYAFIYRVINLYASKLTSGNLESL